MSPDDEGLVALPCVSKVSLPPPSGQLPKYCLCSTVRYGLLVRMRDPPDKARAQVNGTAGPDLDCHSLMRL